MTRLGILTLNGNAHGSKRLVDEARRHGMAANLIVTSESDVAHRANASDKLLIRVGTKGYYVYQDMLSQLAPRHQQTLRAALEAFNKQTSYRLMQSAGLPMPTTTFVEDASQLTAEKLPYIVKLPVGHQGDGVYLAQTVDDVHAIKQTLAGRGLVIRQEFIDESRGEDKRLFVVGDEVVAAMRRSAPQGDFRSNISGGGSALAYVPTDEEIAIAIQTVRLHGLLYGGIDIIDSHDGPLILEVNPSPGFAIEQVTGVNVAEKVIMRQILAD